MFGKIFLQNLIVEENPIEGFFVEINLRNKKKCLIYCSYNNPKKTFWSNHIAVLNKRLDLLATKDSGTGVFLWIFRNF